MMKILKLLTATILLSAFSHSAFADEQADAQMITNSTFCAMYSTRLTQTSDSGLQVKGVNLNARFNGPVFNRVLQVMNKTYGRTWLESNARNGSMTAMQLSQSEPYNPEYARQCDAFADKVERNGAESNPDALYLHPVNRNLLSGRFLLFCFSGGQTLSGGFLKLSGPISAMR
jgi:hypothetical protein